MRRRIGARPLNFRFVVCYAAVAGALSIATAQEAEIVVRQNQPPILNVLPPTAAERTAPGVGKFVIFTREETSREWDHIAGAWECIPSQPQTPLMKRVEFCHSPWCANPLLDTLVADDGDGLHPRFARLQVNKGRGEYTVNIYDINYRTWDVRCIWQGDQFHAFGVLGGSVFCRADDEWCRIDAATGEISKDVPFTPVTTEDEFWIVRKPGETQRCWSYDPRTQQFVAHFADVEKPADGFSWSKLSPDGKHRAWILAPMPRGWYGGPITGRLMLQRDGEAADISVPIEFHAIGGSGVPVIPTHIQFKFAPQGKLVFRAGIGEKAERDRVWTVDVATGKVDADETAHVPQVWSPQSMLDGVPVPDYLREEVNQFGHFGRSGLAPAFLMHLGVIDKKPEFPDCEAGVSRDGRHVLYKALKGPLADEFVYGDLVTKQVVRWKSPDVLKRCNAMDFVWIDTPPPTNGEAR